MLNWTGISIADPVRSDLVREHILHGSALSHSTILSRPIGIPAVVSLPSLSVADLEGRTIAVDGDQGRIFVQPSLAVLET